MDDFKCPICFDGDTNENGELVQKYTLVCLHTFHTKCICESLRYDNRCPVCRDSGMSLESKQARQQEEQDDNFIESIPWKQRLAFRKKFINAGIRYCKTRLNDSTTPEYKHIKAFIRKYDNTKARLKKIKEEQKLITPAYRKIRKEYTNNPIVKQYLKVRPWSTNRKIRQKETTIFRMFAGELTYRELYEGNLKDIIKNQYESTVKTQLLDMPTR